MSIQKFRLENSSLFTYVALLVIFLFCIFVYFLTARINADFSEIDRNIDKRNMVDTATVTATSSSN